MISSRIIGIHLLDLNPGWWSAFSRAAILVSIVVLAHMDVEFARADPIECPKRLARFAERDVIKISGWAALHRAFKRYKACDDGAVGEGFSDRIVVLLSEKWGSLPSLGRLLEKDGVFWPFVLSHIDETADSDALEAILENIRERGCPGLRRESCRELRARTEGALQSSRAVSSPAK